MSKNNGNGKVPSAPMNMGEFISQQMALDTLVGKVREALNEDNASLDDCTRVVTYFSDSHEKRRYFTKLFSANKGEKVQFSYESEEGRLVSRKTGALIIEVLGFIGYSGLSLSAP